MLIHPHGSSVWFFGLAHATRVLLRLQGDEALFVVVRDPGVAFCRILLRRMLRDPATGEPLKEKYWARSSFNFNLTVEIFWTREA